MMRDYRCAKCDRLLFKAELVDARIEIKCICKALVIVEQPQERVPIPVPDWNGMGRNVSMTRGRETPQQKAVSLTTSEG